MGNELNWGAGEVIADIICALWGGFSRLSRCNKRKIGPHLSAAPSANREHASTQSVLAFWRAGYAYSSSSSSSM